MPHRLSLIAAVALVVAACGGSPGEEGRLQVDPAILPIAVGGHVDFDLTVKDDPAVEIRAVDLVSTDPEVMTFTARPGAGRLVVRARALSAGEADLEVMGRLLPTRIDRFSFEATDDYRVDLVEERFFVTGPAQDLRMVAGGRVTLRAAAQGVYPPDAPFDLQAAEAFEVQPTRAPAGAAIEVVGLGAGGGPLTVRAGDLEVGRLDVEVVDPAAVARLAIHQTDHAVAAELQDEAGRPLRGGRCRFEAPPDVEVGEWGSCGALFPDAGFQVTVTEEVTGLSRTVWVL